MRFLNALGRFAALAASLSIPASDGSQPAVVQSQQHSFRIVTVAENIANPWSIAFLPGGDILVTERGGQLRAIRNGTLSASPIAGVPAVRANNQGGLLDVVPHPNFTSNRFIYLSYSKPSQSGQATTAVFRARLDGNELRDITEIFEANAWSRTDGHFGSRLAFDSRGFLFITVGDRQANPNGNQEAHPCRICRITTGV